MITFAGFSKRSSGIIRGQQLSNVIEGSDFTDIDFPSNPKNKVVIQVRKFNEDFARYCKSKNLKVGFDVADNPVTDYLYGHVTFDDFSRYVKKNADFYIVNNDIMKAELSKVTDKKIYVIPHHNCNFNKKVKETNSPKRLGYVGLPDYTINEKIIYDFCKKNDLIFKNRNPQTHKELEPAFEEIDIGIIFFQKESIKSGMYEKTLKFKPNTKLTNFQSFGIPTVCLPYESYKQFGNNQCIFVESFDEMKDNVINLVKDQDLFQTLSKNSIKVAENYHISKVVGYYQQIVEDFRG
jgi:hypothetical protein